MCPQDGCRDNGVSSLCDAIYVHVPFCRHRCHYCDFFTLAGRDDARGAYVQRLLAEARSTLPLLPMSNPTVFVGGGTPTYLDVDDLGGLLHGLASLLPAAPSEWTVEANPETIDAPKAQVMFEAGVRRVSVGMQSAQPASLKALERQHDPDSVPRAVEVLRQAGFQSISLDLIFGIPGQTLADAQADVQAALAMSPDHLSVYGLVYEPGTPLRRRRDAGQVQQVEEEVEVGMYRQVQAMLSEAGFEQYEISNWALPGQRCRHNEVYWTNGNWWPLGPAASGHVAGTRWRTVPRLKQWLDSEGLPPIIDLETRDLDGRCGEVLMLGLRQLQGVPRLMVDQAISAPSRGQARAAAITRHLEAGLLAWREDNLCLTNDGLLLADTVIGDLL
jgi:oxygen-independent coproporphyrinogen-3 oxidase